MKGVAAVLLGIIIAFAGGWFWGWAFRGHQADKEVADYRVAILGTTAAYNALAGRTRAAGADVHQLGDSVRILIARLAPKKPAPPKPAYRNIPEFLDTPPSGGVQTSAVDSAAVDSLPTDTATTPTLWEALRASCRRLADRCDQLAFTADSALAKADTAIAQRDSAFTASAIAKPRAFRVGLAVGGGTAGLLALLFLLLHH